MNIPVQYMQAEGEFSVPGPRQTVNGELVLLGAAENRTVFQLKSGLGIP